MKEHPNKHIRQAVRQALEKGWRLTASTGHVWGQLWCSEANRNGCVIRVFGTPRVPENHARHILRRVAQCPHQGADTQLDQGKQ